MANDVLLDQVLRPSPPLPPRVLLWILTVVGAINLAFVSSLMRYGADSCLRLNSFWL